ncbi:UDP-Glycosyltransferase/glycogen phosphorylase [Colletotrichum somersetense]|nr:UDP-Glycosyltransferase/glycogen phosphorylase [Colletotrichum somersetense]
MTANTAERPTKPSPLILITAFPAEGHVNPLLAIASYLAKKYYELVFLTTPDLRHRVEEAGAESVCMDSPLTEELFRRLAGTASLPFGPERFALEMKTVFMDTLDSRAQKTAEVLALLKARDPSRQIIVIEDVLNWTFLPLRYGMPLPQGFTEIPRSIGIGVAAFMLESRDRGPVPYGLPPDSTHSGRLRNVILQDLLEKGPMKPVMDALQEAMEKLGCTSVPTKHVFRCGYTAYDATLQLCPPSLEYPTSDLPPSVEFIGVLPRKATGPDFRYPGWWSEVERTQQDNRYRHVVFVSQGTVSSDYTELVSPTFEAFANRHDVLVVAALGTRGAQLPSDITIPPNARVVDYMPYDTILEYADVFVSNGGYGALTHAVRNGVPVVLAGESQEKSEVAMRAVYAGVGISLATQRPTAEQIKKGVDEVLRDTKYKKAAMRLKSESDSMDALARVEAKVKEMTQ